MLLKAAERSSLIKNLLRKNPRSRNIRKDWISKRIFPLDKEIAVRWNLPYKIACISIAGFEKDPRFPKKDELMGKRRYWPAVCQFMRARYGMDEKPLPVDGQDHFDRRRH